MNKKHMEKRMNPGKLPPGIPGGNYVFQKTSYQEQTAQAAAMVKKADAVVIGAGAGFSTAAGLCYSGRRFTDNFKEFIDKYGSDYMKDMYTAGFYPFPTQEAKWGYWSKHSYVNRIEPQGLPLYQLLYDMMKEKEHFVITTNVDSQFFKAGFSKENIFPVQGDYGLIQCEKGCHKKTYDAVPLFLQMNQARTDCLIPSRMVPVCPVCKGPMAMNLRCDQYFVEDEDWHRAARRWQQFAESSWEKKVLLLELGVGFNTPGIIRFPFEKMMRENEKWSLLRLNLNEAIIPEGFGKRAVGINEDMEKSLWDLAGEIKEGGFL